MAGGHEANADSPDKHATSYAGAVQIAKHHLSVCLKLLGIMYRNDEERSKGGSGGPDEPSTWPSESGGDGLYLAMVMLNSALLKALHVADSFQLHCHREFPRLISQHELCSVLDEFGGDVCAELSRGGRGGAAAASGEAEDARAEGVGGQEYRRLQAECLVLCETARSLERQREGDEARASQLEEECRQLREAIARKRAAALGEEPPSEKPPTDGVEVSQLQSLGVTAERRTCGGAVISDSEFQKLVLIVQNLNRIVQEARADASGAVQHADDALKHASEARQESEELRVLLSGGTSTGQVQVDLRETVQRMQEEVRRAREQQAALERLKELQVQDALLEQHCHDLYLENSQLQEAVFEEQTGSGRTLSQDAASALGGLKPSVEAVSAREVGRRAPQVASLQQQSRVENSYMLAGQTHATLETSWSAPLLVAADSEAFSSPESFGSDGRPLARALRKPQVRGGGHDVGRRPLPMASSQHQVPAHSQQRSARRTAVGYLEERQFTKAALRYAKNPADSQALGKLASLLGGKGQRPDDAWLEQPGSTSGAEGPAHHPEVHVQAVATQLGQPQPRSASPAQADLAARRNLLLQGGRTGRSAACQNARMTWPTPEQRAHAQVARGPAGQATQPSIAGTAIGHGPCQRGHMAAFGSTA